MILMYGFSVLPFVYAFSFIFDVPSTGYTWICVLGIFSGMFFGMTFVAISLSRTAKKIRQHFITYILIINTVI